MIVLIAIKNAVVTDNAQHLAIAKMRRKHKIAILVIASISTAVMLTIAMWNTSQIIWVSDVNVGAPDGFMYVMFPSDKAISYSDQSLSINKREWKRAILNQFVEHGSMAISAWDEIDQQYRYVDERTMDYLPADGISLDEEMDAMVKIVGDRISRRKIVMVRYEYQFASSVAMVTLSITTKNTVDVYEYKVIGRTVVPVRWRRRTG